MSDVRVVKPGLLTTVQDLGRWGFQARGVPVAGPMDPWSHRLANALVGNVASAAALEVTVLGPELEFDDERIVAVAGGAFQTSIDGRGCETNCALRVPAGSRLLVGASSRGARAYLAIAGGIDVAPVLGSRATHVVSAMGGVGRPLKTGDRLPLGERPRRSAPRVPTAAPVVRLPVGAATARVLPGPQRERFAANALAVLQSAPYTLASESDRMGFRLRGPALTHAGGADIISDATAVGVLQVPASGQPILLMADRQTAGGYPKIATVITADIGLVGQLAPGDAIRFEVCSLAGAMSALIAQERALLAFEEETP